MVERWHIARIEPQSEAMACRILRVRQYEVYYPALPKRVRKGNGVTCMVMRPMFPSYLFVAESSRGWEWLRTTPGVRTVNSLLMINGHFAVLPENEIERIAAKEKELINQIINPAPIELPYCIGNTVKVIDGAFAGFYANIEALDDHERIALLMDIFGRPTRVFASHAQLLAT